MGKVEELLLEHAQRPTPQTAIEIGEMWERFYNGQTGILFRALVNARIREQISNPEDSKTSADRRLGRAEGIQMLQDDIEFAISQMHNLIQPQEGDNNG